MGNENYNETRYEKQQGGYDPKIHEQLSYDFIHKQIEKIKQERAQNFYIVKNTSNYLKYKDIILRKVKCRDQMLYIFVREYSKRMAYREITGDYLECLTKSLTQFEDHYEDIANFHMFNKFDCGLQEFKDRDVDNVYKIFIHVVYRLTLYSNCYENFNLPPEEYFVDQVLDLVDDYYHHFNSSYTTIDEFLIKHVADCLDKKQPA